MHVKSWFLHFWELANDAVSPIKQENAQPTSSMILKIKPDRLVRPIESEIGLEPGLMEV